MVPACEDGWDRGEICKFEVYGHSKIQIVFWGDTTPV